MRLIIRRIKYSWLLWTRQKSENKHVTWALKGSDWKRSFLSFRINILFYSIFSLPTLFKYQFWKEKKRSGMFILICISYEVNILVALLDLTLSRRGNEKAWKKSGWLFFKRAWPNIETIFAEKLDELDNFRPAFYVWTYNHSENNSNYFLHSDWLFSLIIGQVRCFVNSDPILWVTF